MKEISINLNKPKVKALEWFDEGGSLTAIGSAGKYKIYHFDKYIYLTYQYQVDKCVSTVDEYIISIDVAKETAQNHFNKLVLGCLED